MATRIDMLGPRGQLQHTDFPQRPRPPLKFARPTVVTFDDVTDGTVVDTHYAANGVRFASVMTSPSRRWSCYARSAWGIESAPNGVSVVAPPQLSLFDARQGGIEATFDKPQQWASIDAQPVLPPEYFGVPTAGPFIEAYAADGRLLDRARYPLAFGVTGWGSWQTLTVKAADSPIARVVISSSYDARVPVYGLFDRLAFGNELTLMPIPLGG
ncbi:MAG: hypothetical protein MZW92_04445 [Comamonadaceae bacterium]|nr:hypothetical protein [Comamonadaceae bacterium]